MSGCTPQAVPVATAATGKKIKVAIDPVTRIEGHLKVEVEVDGGKVVDAKCSGGMFRGFETILKGRDPRDASQIVQRICGVCPTAHATASSLALDDAFNVKLTDNGRIARNLILGANYLQSHILHFYHLAALDYVNGPDVAPFIPRYKKNDIRLDKATNDIGVGQYLEALEIRKVCHEMVALLGGKMPHVQGIVVGGTTEIPTREKLNAYAERFKIVRKFVEEKYLPLVYLLAGPYGDLLKTGSGHKNCIAFGVFPMDNSGTNTLLKAGAYTDGKDSTFDPAKIKEYVKYSFFDDATTGLPPNQGKTVPDPEKAGAYSFIKAPRYDGKPHEGGPLARMWVTNPELSKTGQNALGVKKMRDIGDAAFSILGRHVARAEETLMVAQAVEQWLSEAKPGAETFVPAPIPESAEGLGLTEAPRGALLHYIDIKNSVISNYQITSATIWNANPMDDMGQRGPIEQALIGVPVPDVENPVNVGRLIRSFDP
ncbi:Periplasmic (NiFeSe) hydrogenase large subunit [Desulfamplus magnetovallimortis]|uniref:Periplasmic (NiFeSe) hydrogenase large subunit n=2 Tax=Desulfamplus magnetovallimortis TaxID=1246637 RepID=A0A1W1HCJ6_9BACT|nr:Periplasmic (NiFeSe) hydrogenase large subunit [Desulfamplus magnetovallimortis]